MEKHTGKVRFGVIGTNFITDWVIAGARQDERFESVSYTHLRALYFYLFGRDGKKPVDRCRVYRIA